MVKLVIALATVISLMLLRRHEPISRVWDWVGRAWFISGIGGCCRLAGAYLLLLRLWFSAIGIVEIMESSPNDPRIVVEPGVIL